MARQAIPQVLIENLFNPAAGAGVLIQWTIADWLVDYGPWTFDVQRSTGGDTWTDVGQVTDQSWIYDREHHQAGTGIKTWYRVRLTTGPGTVYVSEPMPAGFRLEGPDFRLYRKLVRDFNRVLRLPRGTGVRGWLLQVPDFGDPSANVDPNTGEVLDGQSAEDYGTGYLGGYWPEQELWAEIQPEKRVARVDQNRGLLTAVSRIAIFPAFPRARPGDIWVRSDTDERFTIGSDVAVVDAVRGYPVSVSASLSLIDAGDVVYQVPVGRA